MCKRVSRAVILAMAVGCTLIASAQADITTGLVGHWPLDGDAQDASGNGNHGKIMGNVTAVADRQGNPKSAMRFPGATSAYIDLGQPPSLLIKGAMTVSAWVRTDNLAQTGRIIAKQGPTSGRSWGLNLETAKFAQFDVGVNPTDRVRAQSAPLSFSPKDWFHVAGVFRPGVSVEVYINGVLGKKEPTAVTVQWIENGLPINIGRRPEPGTAWNGDIDEARMYARDLSASDIRQLVFGQPGLPTGPAPAHEATDVPPDSILSWTPGEFAATHNIYLGTTYQDVNAASVAKPLGVLVRAGQEVSACDPGPLEFGKTYYWRVDEVNKAPDTTIYKGDVWSFTVEPLSYPIKPVKATASSAQPNMGPEKTIDGSGMTGDLHDIVPSTMWMSTGAAPNWIQYEFDQIYKLQQLAVWYSNQQIESFLGFGAKKVTVETSLDGAAWTPVANVPEFAKAPGAAGYAANTTVNLGSVEAKFVKLTIQSPWGTVSQTGLSEVRFFHVPVQARAPQPASAATGVSLDTALDWRPGREATSHRVFFGADPGALALAKTVTDHGYVPDALNFGTKYFWKVDEVGAAAIYPGAVWSFTTQEYRPIEGFETYTDKQGEEVFAIWVDGMTNSNGSIVGLYPDSVNGTFCERTIIHGGKQSMPFEYNNVKTPYYSEAERTFDTPQDWTGNGATTLALWYLGHPMGLVDKGNNAFSVTSAGTDIAGNTDQFRFVFKSLTGDGSITAKVDSLVNTNAWAKGGVMIRENLEANSRRTHCVMTPGNGAAFERRETSGGASASLNTPGLKAPYWVRLTRTGSIFKGEASPDGKTWTQIGTEQTVVMGPNVYLGLAVTSHNAGVTTTAEFSNVSTTGTVTGAWQNLSIGVTQKANTPGPLYVTVEDKAGKKKTVVNPDPAAVTKAAWTQWQIAFGDLTGVNLAAVKKLTIGVGDRANPKAGGAGTLYFDDLGFGRPVSAK